MTPRELAEQLIERNADASTYVGCDCGGYEAWLGDTTDQEDIQEETVAQLVVFIEHVAYDHAERRSITLIRNPVLIDGYELGVLLNDQPRTEHERKWRVQQKLDLLRKEGILKTPR
jgi:hypothetical protein